MKRNPRGVHIIAQCSSVPWSVLCVLLLWLVAVAGSGRAEAEYCQRHGNKNTCEVQLEIALKEVEDSWIGENKLFFIECSGRSYLKSRQACAVESAARHSNVPVIVLLVSEHLDLSENNATRQVYQKFSRTLNPVVHFRRIDPESFLSESPLGNATQELLERIQASPKPVPHLSDALRLAVIYRFGGWYADIDTITMKPLTDFQTNVISTDSYYPEVNGKLFNSEGHEIVGESVANGYFRFAEAESLFLKECLFRFRNRFRGNMWSSGGSGVMTPTLFRHCRIKPAKEGLKITLERYTAENCNGLQVVHPITFYPCSWMHSGALFSPYMTQEFWDDYVKDSHSIDFFHSSSENNVAVLKRKNYGTNMPAYVALAPKYCPLAYDSQKVF